MDVKSRLKDLTTSILPSRYADVFLRVNEPYCKAVKELVSLEEIQFPNHGEELRYKAKVRGPKPDKGYALLISFHGTREDEGLKPVAESSKVDEHEEIWNANFKKYTLNPGYILLVPFGFSRKELAWHSSETYQLVDELVRLFFLSGMVDLNRVYAIGFGAGADAAAFAASRSTLFAAALVLSPELPTPLIECNSTFLYIVKREDESSQQRIKVFNYYKSLLVNLQKVLPQEYPHKTEEYTYMIQDIPQKSDPVIWFNNYVTRNPLYPRTILFKDSFSDKTMNRGCMEVVPAKHAESSIAALALTGPNAVSLQVSGIESATVYFSPLLFTIPGEISVKVNDQEEEKHSLVFDEEVVESSSSCFKDPYFVYGAKKVFNFKSRSL